MQHCQLVVIVMRATYDGLVVLICARSLDRCNRAVQLCCAVQLARPRFCGWPCHNAVADRKDLPVNGLTDRPTDAAAVKIALHRVKRQAH